MQKIESTLENKVRQKSQTIHSSSTVFWCIVNKDKGIDTRISFLNHFFLKRNIPSVSMRLCIRDMDGVLIKETIAEITEPRVYSYSLSDLLCELDLFKGEFSVYIEFTSSHNLGVPFCAVISEITSPSTIDVVHTYGRALESQEIGTKIDFDSSYETGWSLWNVGKNYSNSFVFHNGRLHAKLAFSLTILLKGNKIASLEPIEVVLAPFATYRGNLEYFLTSLNDRSDLLDIIQGAAEGDIDVKLKIEGLKSAFPRLLFVCAECMNDSNHFFLDSLTKINFTHSNFDFDCAVQPKSSLSYGYINNPRYPAGVETGFRYYPCNELSSLSTNSSSALSSEPIPMSELSSLRVSSESPIASRIVGGNWSKWIGSSLVKECSTGTFIVEYVQHAGYWHWGRLLPKGNNFSAMLSFINPFAGSDDSYCFTVCIYSDSGLCREESFEFNGPKASLEIASDDSFCNGAWYVVKGEGVGEFNVFSTIYFNDFSDGTVEHAF